MTKLSEKLRNNECDTYRINDGEMVELGTGEQRRVVLENSKNTYNENNGVYNIYDENGSLWATANPYLVDSLTRQYGDLRRDKDMGVELSNGVEPANMRREKWREIKARGADFYKSYHAQKAAETEKGDMARKEREERIAALRGMKQQETPAVKKTEVTHEMSAQMMKRSAER